MEVSNFEILYKPITPSLGAGTEAIARRVLQGYFLSVANTSTFDFIFKIAFNITLPSPIIRYGDLMPTRFSSPTSHPPTTFLQRR